MQQISLINRKKKRDPLAHFLANFLAIVAGILNVQTLLKWQCDRTFRPRTDVSGYFLICKFFFADSKISTSTRVRIQYSNLPVHTYPDSFSVHQLICKAIFGSSENFITSLYFAGLTCLRRQISPSYMERSFKMSNRRLA